MSATKEEEIEELPPRQEKLVASLVMANMDVSTIEAALATIAGHLPTRPLDYRIDDEGHIYQLTKPAQWSYEQLQAGEFPLLCNGDRGNVVTFDIHALPPTWVDPNTQARELFLYTPYRLEFVNRALTLTHALGCSLPSLWGRTDSVTTGGRIADEFVDQWASHRGEWIVLPPAMPILISWVNYWSAETCRLLDFDIHGPKRKLFAKVLDCQGGGVAMQLTEDPLDLDRPEHMAALEAAYDAFPAVHRKDRSRLH